MTQRMEQDAIVADLQARLAAAEAERDAAKAEAERWASVADALNAAIEDNVLCFDDGLLEEVADGDNPWTITILPSHVRATLDARAGYAGLMLESRRIERHLASQPEGEVADGR